MRRPPRIISEAMQAHSFSRRAWMLGAAQAGVGVMLAGRMAWLSIAENERYNILSESNRVNATLIPPRRGWLIDRNGAPIANNRTDFRVDILPDRLEDDERVIALLAQILKLPPEEIARLRLDLDRAPGFQPVQVAEQLDWERFAAVSVRLPELPGVQPTRGFARNYPLGAAVAHLTGYVGAPTAEPELVPSRRAAYSCKPASIVSRVFLPGTSGRVGSSATSLPRAVTSIRLAPG